MYGQTLIYKNQASLRAKSEQLGQIGIYPTNFQAGEKNKESDYQQIYRNFVITEKLRVFKDEKSILIAPNREGRWEIDSDNLKLTESDIINSYKIAQEIENQQVKTRNNSFGFRSIATDSHAPNRQIIATKSMQPLLLAGLQKAKTSPSANCRQTSQKLLSRNKQIENGRW